MKSTLSCVLMFVFTLLGAQSNSTLLNVLANLDSIDQVYDEGRSSNRYYFLREEQVITQAKAKKKELETLERMDSALLSRQDQITRSTLLLKLNDELSTVKFKTYLMPFNAEGGFYNNPTFSLSNRSFGTTDDYTDYEQWMRSFGMYLDYNLELLKKGVEAGVMRPKVIVENTISLLEPWLGAVEDQVFYQPYITFSNAIPDEQQSRLQNNGRSIIKNELMPRYHRLKDFLVSEYLPKAPASPGISSITNGKKYYEDRIQFYTTQDLTPDSVFALGQSEVIRIRSLMEQVIADVGFEGGFEDFIAFLRTDPQFYARSAQELLNHAAWLSKKAEGQLPPLFKTLYELPFTVAPVPMSIAPNYTGGRYVPGSRSQNRPGTYWVNTYDLPSRPFYTLPALTLHEAVPGHHLGIMVAAELTTDIPDFRKNYYISAYGEGWGLYAEYLGEEMGMYTTPYELFGRYTYEMWRACRLVVDVGLHYHGWSRQRALDFLANNTALSLHEVKTEIDRYIGWPGQAVSYKIGELTIKSLRAQAEQELGANFDIQQFHEVILANGSIPLDELRTEVERYIQETLK